MPRIGHAGRGSGATTAKGNVPIRSLKVFNQVTAASHYRTKCSRKNEKRSIRRSTRERPRSGFCTALVPPSRPHLFSRGSPLCCPPAGHAPATRKAAGRRCPAASLPAQRDVQERLLRGL